MTRTASQVPARSSKSALDVALPATGGALVGLVIGAGVGGDSILFGLLSAVGLAAFLALLLLRPGQRNP